MGCATQQGTSANVTVYLITLLSYMVSVPVGIHAVEGEFNPDETRVEGNLLAQTTGKI